MKRLYQLVIAMALVQSASGQAYIPFPLQNAVWNVTYSDLQGSLTHISHFDIVYFTEGDTLLNGNTYTILKKNVHEYAICIAPWNPGCNDYDLGITYNTYVGAYRENAGHQILLIEPGDSLDCVLLDYGLATGDTMIKNCPVNYYEMGIAVTGNSDSTLLLDGLYHLRQEIIANFPGYLIDGVGTTFGFPEPLTYFENNAVLNCMLVNGITIYTSTGDTVCQYGFAGITENKAEQLEVYPVPATDQLNIKTTAGHLLKKIELIDLTGRTVLQDHPVTATVTLNTNAFVNGCYFIRITDQYDRQTIRKIVLQ